MISPDLGETTGTVDLPRDGSHLARVEWHARKRREEAASAKLGARSTGGLPAGAAPAAPVGRPLGLSNCHTSPREFFPTPLHAFVHSPQAKKLNEKQHGEYIEAKVVRDQKRRVRFHYEGTLIRIEGIPGWEEYENAKRSKRGAVSGFSAKSRIRMLNLVSSLKADALPVFVTLTYDREWNTDPLVWKKHLDTFGKWLLREHPQASFIWKLEPQQRGAPHFHLLVYGIEFLPWQLLAVRWVEIVSGSKFPPNFPFERGRRGAALFKEWIHSSIENREVMNHLEAGTQVKPVRSRRGVMCYCSKKYMGKECALPDGWEKVGRFWGVVGRKSLPRSKVEEMEVSRSAFFKVRRIARRWFASKGLRRKSSGTLTLYTSAHWQWLRVIEWASGLPPSPSHK